MKSAMQVLEAEYRGKKQKADQLVATAKTQEELDAVADVLSDCERLALQIRSERYASDVAYDLGRPAAMDQSGITRMRNRKTGQDMALLSNNVSVCNYLLQSGQSNGVNPAELSMGKYLLGKITGDWRGAEAEREAMQLAQVGRDDASGGFLVPDVVGAGIIDKARAQSVIIKAGARTIPDAGVGDTISFATVETDPEFRSKGELGELYETSVVFGKRMFNAKTIGCVLEVSRELMDDSPNFAEVLNSTLAKAIATWIDRLSLQGSGAGTDGLEGLANFPTSSGMTETTSVGSPDWLDLSTGALAIRNLNLNPTAIILNPDGEDSLCTQVTGDGTNSPKGWLGAPPTVVDLPRYPTTSCPASNIFLGDFSEFAVWTRLAPEIMLDPFGSSFSKFGVKVRCVWRGDVGPMRYEAFHRLSGVS